VAIKPILQFRNADSTLDLNTTQAKIVDRAIFDGGSLTPSGVSLQVSIAPFIATGYDGIVAVSDATETRSVPAPAAAGPDRVSYLILHLEYRSLTTPIFNLQLVPETTWLTSVSRNFFITFAKFTVPFGATSLTDPGVEIDYAPGDWADKLGKTGWRQPVATVASLPTTQNRDGDVRIAFDTRLAYQWNATTETWTPVGGAINLAETASRNAESKAQFHRVTSGSGILNEIPQSIVPDPGSSVAGDAVHGDHIPVNFPFVPLPAVANLGIIPGAHYLMNGHFIKTHATDITFAAPPGVGERYDLLILEAWREPIVLPASETYDDEGSVARPFSYLRNYLEKMLEQGGTLAPSLDLSEMEAYDSSTFVVTRYQYRVISNVNVSVLTDTATVAGAVNNVDGNPFVVGTNTDQKLWQAPAVASSIDDVSWALPLLVVRRTSDELAGPPYIDTFRSNNQRYIFDVCPRAELGMGLFEIEEALKSRDRIAGIAKRLERASGFVTGTDAPIVPDVGTITVPASVIHVQGRTLYWNNPQLVDLPAPPATGGRTDVIVLEVLKTIYPTPDRIANSPMEIGARDRIGPKALQWFGRFRTFTLPLNILQTTVEGAMTATTAYTPAFDDPALWARVPDVTTGEDPNGEVYALPIALVHRRNTGAYALTAIDQNGADRSAFPGLPNQLATHPYEGEVLDVRSQSVVDPEELQRILDQSFDKLIGGDLRTNMAVHPIAASVAGKQLLHVDLLAAGALAGTNLIPRPPNGSQTVWSESDEAELFTWNFLNMDVNHTDPNGVFTWTAATNTLGISLPPGYMLSVNPQLPANPYGPQGFVGLSIDGNVAGDRRPYPMQHTYFTGGAPIGWFIQGDPVTPQPMRQTEVVLNLDPSVAYTEAASVVLIQVWGVKRNHEAGRSSALNSYAGNRGLFAVPDTVHRIEYSLTGLAPFTRAWVGVPLNVIDVPVVGDACVIDRATLFASGSISSQIASNAANLQVYAVADVTLNTTTSLEKLRYIQFTDDAAATPAFQRTRIEFTPASVPGGTTARVTLVCLGDLVDHWFEVSPGSKQIRGPYTIGQNFFSITASAQHLTFPTTSTQRLMGWGDCGIGVQGAMTTSGQHSSGGLGSVSLGNSGTELSFYAAGTGAAAWEIWFNSADRNSVRNISIGQTVGLQRAVDPSAAPGSFMDMGAHSAFFSAKYDYTAGVFGNHNSIVLAPVRDPLPTGSAVRIYYEYTPYQGITNDLETLINGTVEGITDQLVFTNGLNKPWIDYRMIGAGLLRSSTSFCPPGVMSGIGYAGHDFGLLVSKGRAVDRNVLTNADGMTTYDGYFAVTDRARPYRPADRPPIAISQRLPFPTKAANGASVGSRYSPESFLSHTTILDEPAVRPVPPGQGYARSEASPWLLEYSGASPDERVWRAQGTTKTLYFPMPVHIGETIVGLTIETESAGPSGIVFCSFVSRDRVTGTITPGTETFYALVRGPASTRLLQEISLIPGLVSSNANQEVLLAMVSSTSNLRVGQITVSVVPNQIFFGASPTLRRYPYNELSIGVGPTLKKGMKIEVPSTWTTEFAAYEAAFTQSGRQDVSGVSPPRGRAFVSTLLGSTTYGAGGLIGYVPGAQPSLTFPLAGATAAPAYAGRDTGQRINMKARTVLTGATAPDTSVGSALAYIVHNDQDFMHMGVSTGYTNITDGTAVVRVGQAVDAFYPVGRPVFRRT